MEEEKIRILTYKRVEWGWSLKQEITFLKSEMLKKFRDNDIPLVYAAKTLDLLSENKDYICPVCKQKMPYKRYDGLDIYECDNCHTKLGEVHKEVRDR